MKVWNNVLFPTLNHNTMLTNYDVMLKKNEIKLIDDYVVQNNLPEMNFVVFRNVVCNVLPNHRAEQLVGEFYHDDCGLNNYKKYLSFNI
jgi:hypothetical protein